MMSDSWTWRDTSRWRGSVDDPHSVRASGAKLGDGVCQGAVWVYVEYGVGVLAVDYTALGEDDGDKVDA